MTEICVSDYLQFPTLVEYLVPTLACIRPLRICTLSGAALCIRFAFAVPALVPQERISDSMPWVVNQNRSTVCGREWARRTTSA